MNLLVYDIFRIFVGMIITKDNINQFINNNDWDDKDIMNCGNMGVTKIDYIPDNIKYLDCQYNRLTELPKLPESLIGLFCHNNNLPYKVTLNNLKQHNKLTKRKQILSKICG